MCGIVGYVGKRAASDILISSLQRLEYRGYDSAGIAVPTSQGLSILKCSGKVRALESRVHATWSRRCYPPAPRELPIPGGPLTVRRQKRMPIRIATNPGALPLFTRDHRELCRHSPTA
jgi:hypothetical protein